ncbi:MAG: DUF1080 domain-containing protein [Bacteroidota bacterium]
MKLPLHRVIGLLLLLFGCTPDTEMTEEIPVEEEQLTYLPFTQAAFNNLDLFADPTANWSIVGEVFVDRSQKNTIEVSQGNGVLVNQPTEDAKSDLYTAFEHGDIELELEIMMPKGSNSGIYLQSRYEVQLLDSWGKEVPKSGDMGGIYQRWDDDKPEGEKGYEGYAPRVNATKAPGLWQSLKMVFHAPRFDEVGQKTKDAWFEEIWLNGVLIHENVSLSGPTRGAVSEKEVALAPIRIQGDHGPVAFRNLRYKLYENKQVVLKNVQVKEYESEKTGLPNLSRLKLKKEEQTDSISYAVGSTRDKFCLVYEGELSIPSSGDYLFKMNVNEADVAFIVDQDTLFTVNDVVRLGYNNINTINLAAGTVPFTLIYNKSRRWWSRGFKLFVEGPNMQSHSLHAPSSAFAGNPPPPITIEREDQAVLQRGFLMHNDEKLTHAISVGTPQKINYSYDLATGTLLQVWGGDFLDVTDMWHARGNKQLSRPLGAIIDFHGQPSIAKLESEKATWPDSLENEANFKPLGYELDEQGNPIFFYEIHGTTMSNQFFPSSEERRITRKIEMEGNQSLWLKLDDGATIQKLKDGSYAMNDYEYFLEMKDNLADKVTIRDSKGRAELLLKLDADTRAIEYDIIW